MPHYPTPMLSRSLRHVFVLVLFVILVTGIGLTRSAGANGTATLTVSVSSSPAGGTDFPILLGLQFNNDQYGPGVTSQFDTIYQPTDVAVDASGNVFIIDSGLSGPPRVVKYNQSGAYQTHWGSIGGIGGQFSESPNPQGIATDAAGNVYVADTGNHRIQKFNNNGVFLMAFGKNVDSVNASTGFEVCTVAADCQAGSSGGLGGEMNLPHDVTVDPNGILYVADTWNHRIQKFSAAAAFQWAVGRDVIAGNGVVIGETCTVAANCKAGTNDNWYSRQFHAPRGVAANADFVYVTDTNNNRVQVLDPDGFFEVMWGWDVDEGGPAVFEFCTSDPCPAGYAGQSISPAHQGGAMTTPVGIAVDEAGNVVVVDNGGLRFQMFHYYVDSGASPTGAFLGAWGRDVANDGADNGFEMCTTANTACKKGIIVVPFDGSFYLGGPTGAAFDASGNVLILDSNQAYRFDRVKAQVDHGENDVFTLDPGSYRVDEFVPEGWLFNGVACTGGGNPQAGGYGAAVTLAAGDDVTCTFNNYLTDTTNGSIQVAKSVPSGAGGTFTICVSGGPDDLAEECRGFVDDGATQTWRGLPPGAGYIVSEDDPGPDWVAPDDQEVSVSAATTTLVTVTNNQAAGSITVVKTNTVYGDGVPTEDWAYSGTLGNFTIDAAGGQQVFNNLTPGSYTITETPQDGFFEYSPSCGFGNGNGSGGSITFTLEPNENVTCYVDSFEEIGSVKVKKVVDGVAPDYDWLFTGDLGTFFLPAAGGEETINYNPYSGEYVYSGAYTITETVDLNYDTAVSCDTGASGDNSVTVTLGFGEDVTCTFTNTYSPPVPGSIKVTKAIVGSDYPADPEFEICVAGGPENVAEDCRAFIGDGGMSVWTGLPPGDGYNVFEREAGSWWVWPSTQTVSVNEGAQTDVTVTNVWSPPAGSIVVTKEIIGSGYPDDPTFNVCLSGPPGYECKTITGDGGTVTFTGLPDGDYTVIEDEAGLDWKEPDDQLVTVSGGGQTDVTVTNTYTPLTGKLIFHVAEEITFIDFSAFYSGSIGLGPSSEIGPSLSPDGTQVFFAGNFFGNYEIMVTETDGGAPVNLTQTDDATEYYLDLSPDGSQIAFSRQDFSASQGDLWVMNADGSNPLNITNSDLATEEMPAWSPDGTRIAFVRDLDIWVMDADGGNQLQLTSGSDGETNPAWSPDGSRIIFNRGSDRSDLVLIDSDGTDEEYLTHNPEQVFDITPEYSPDGRHIAVGSFSDGLFIMEADGSNKSPVLGSPDFGGDPDWRTTPTTGALRVTKFIHGSGYPADPSFEVCLTGGSIGATPDCKTITGDEGTVRWSNLAPADDYTVTESDAGPDWEIGSPQTGLSVVAGQRTDVILHNTWEGGGGDPSVFYITPGGRGRVGGIAFEAADILRYDRTANQWQMVYDGSARGTREKISAFTMLGDGSLLLVWGSNQRVTIGGTLVTVKPHDVVRFIPDTPGSFPLSAGTYELYVSGAAVGLTTNAEKIDAIDSNGDRLYLSTTGNAAVGPGNSITAQDEDVLSLDQPSLEWSPALELNGTAIPGMSGEDVNGYWRDFPGGNRYLTIAGSFTIGNTTFGRIKGNGKSIVLLTPDGDAPGGYVPSLVTWLAPGVSFPSTVVGIELAR